MDMKAELSKLKKKYTSREKDSVKHEYGPGEYLAIRLDGVRFTHKYSRKEFITEFMNTMISDTVFEVYQVLFNKHEKDLKNLVLCVVQVNDEVTFILNKGDNKYDRRILKILSIINGLMSSWSTNIVLERQRKNTKLKTKIEYYDARPIILSDTEDITNYVKYRYLVAKKHALAKTLKFNNVKITPPIWENISRSKKMVAERKLEAEFHKIENTFTLYVPAKDYSLNHIILTESCVNNLLKKLIVDSNKQKCTSSSNIPQIKELIERRMLSV